MTDETCDLQSSVPDWMIDYPALQPLFDDLGLDASCGGRSLEYECRRRGHDPDRVLQLIRRRLEESGDGPRPG